MKAELRKRGRPRLLRPVGDRITGIGLTASQAAWLKGNHKVAGFESGAALQRWILNQFIARVERSQGIGLITSAYDQTQELLIIERLTSSDTDLGRKETNGSIKVR